MITLSFPDGAKRQVEEGISGADLAASISKSLAKKSVAIELNGVLADLADPITSDATVRLVSREDPQGLESDLRCLP